MGLPSPRQLSARQDFQEARQRAALQDILARFTGRSTALLSYEQVYHQLRASGMAPAGRQDIPVAAIVGSVGRYADFSRSFLPLQKNDEERWVGVHTAATDVAGLPPIEVYQIGEAYFVLDGHHRVSVARQLGATHIDAYVTEVRTKVPLTPDMQLADVIRLAEYAVFLEDTHLDQTRPGHAWQLSEAGQYMRLEQHIEIQRFLLENELGRELSFEEAAWRWHDDIYLPIVEAIREQGVLRDFPGRTRTDLYVWLVQHRLTLQREVGGPVAPEQVVADWAQKFTPRPLSARLGQRLLETVLPESLVSGPAPGQWRATKIEARYSDHLLAEILVPLNDSGSGWEAVAQALVLAQREQARVRGLHVTPTDAHKQRPVVRALQAEFDRRCEQAGVTGTFTVEVGNDIARHVAARAVLADLVVLNLAHPPEPQPLARLSSGFRTLLHHCPRPVLAVPKTASAFTRLLLAYDGSPKAQEAKFIAAYFAEQWRLPLVVVTVLEGEHVTRAAVTEARTYLEWHEIQAEYVTLDPTREAEAILNTATTHGCDVVILGGYGRHPVMEMMLGSTVETLLRTSTLPLLICR